MNALERTIRIYFTYCTLSNNLNTKGCSRFYCVVGVHACAHSHAHTHTHTHTHVCCKRELETDSLTYASSSVADVGGKWGQLGIGINEPSFDSWSAPKTYFIILGLQSTPFRAWCLFIHIAISSFITLVIYFPQSVSIPLLKQGSLFIHLTTHRAKLFEIVYL